MNRKITLIALAVIMMAAVPMIVSDASDASVSMNDDSIWGEGFTNTADGTLYVKLTSTEPADQKITITVSENGKDLASVEVTVPAYSEYTAGLRFRLNGIGEHELTVTGIPAGMFPQLPNGTHNNTTTTTVTVTESLWSKPSVYAAIAVIAILIVIAVFLKIRSAPATKPDVTFTELDKRQKESKGDVAEVPKTSATEKKRYAGSDGAPKETAKPAAPPEEKKAASFTELEKQKTQKKEAAPKKKEPSSEEPKKLKYVSSRRK